MSLPPIVVAALMGSSGGSAPFAPTDIANLSLWLDGADTTTLAVNSDGTGGVPALDGTIGRWADKSGNDRHAAQATAGFRPKRAHSASSQTLGVYFTTDDYLVGSWSGDARPRTVFAVCKPHSVTNGVGGAIFESSTGALPNTGNSLFWARSAGNLTLHARRGATQDSVIDVGDTISSADAPRLITAIYEVASSSLAVNDGAPNVNSNTVANVTVANFQLGALFTPVYFLDGMIYEYIAYEAALSAGDQELVENFLADKWGITL